MASRLPLLLALARAATTVVVAVVMLWTSIAGATARCDTDQPTKGCCCAKPTDDDTTPTDRASRFRDRGCCEVAPADAPQVAAVDESLRDVKAALAVVDPGFDLERRAVGDAPLRLGLARGPPSAPSVPLFIRHCAYLV